MFDQKKIETYQSISAPANLRERVFSSCESQLNNSHSFGRRNLSLVLRRLPSAAACLVLVIVVLSVFQTENSSGISVVVSGNELKVHSTISVTPEHDVLPLRITSTEPTTPSVAFSITLTLPETTTISVSHGTLQTTTDATVSSGTTLTADGQLSIIWHINPDDTKHAFVMTLQSDMQSEALTLAYEEKTDTWSISRGGKK